MKKLLSFLSIFLTTSTAVGTVIACSSGSDSSDDGNNDDLKLELEKGMTNVTLSDGDNNISATIKNYKNIVSAGYTFTKPETLFGQKSGDNYDGKYADSFSVSDIDSSNGKFSVTFKSIGVGAVKLTATKGSSELTFFLGVNCKRDLSVTNSEGKIPSSITVNASRGSDLTGDGKMAYDAKNDFTINNVYDLVNNGYKVSYTYENKYDNEQSIFTGTTSSSSTSGEFTITDSKIVDSNNSEWLSVDDKNVVKFDSSKVAYSGSGVLTFTVSFDTTKKDSDEYKNLSDLGLLDKDGNYTPDPIAISIGSFGYSMLKSENATITSDSGGAGETGNNGNFFKMNTTGDASLSLDLGTTKSIGANATMALLIPTSYFTGDSLKVSTIGLSTSTVNLKNDSDSYDVTIYAKGYSKSDVKINDNAPSDSLIGDSDTFTLTVTKDLGASIKIGVGDLSSTITVTNDADKSTGSTGDSVAPIMDLSKAKSKLTTKDVDGVSSWSLSKATYVNLDVLSSIMDGQSEYYAFYDTISTASYTTFSYDIDKTDDKLLSLSCVLSGEFDITKLLNTQSSSDAGGTSIYNEFIDSISSLYLPSNA